MAAEPRCSLRYYKAPAPPGTGPRSSRSHGRFADRLNPTLVGTTSFDPARSIFFPLPPPQPPLSSYFPSSTNTGLHEDSRTEGEHARRRRKIPFYPLKNAERPGLSERHPFFASEDFVTTPTGAYDRTTLSISAETGYMTAAAWADLGPGNTDSAPYPDLLVLAAFRSSRPTRTMIPSLGSRYPTPSHVEQRHADGALRTPAIPCGDARTHFRNNTTLCAACEHRDRGHAIPACGFLDLKVKFIADRASVVPASPQLRIRLVARRSHAGSTNGTLTVSSDDAVEADHSYTRPGSRITEKRSRRAAVPEQLFGYTTRILIRARRFADAEERPSVLAKNC